MATTLRDVAASEPPAKAAAAAPLTPRRHVGAIVAAGVVVAGLLAWAIAVSVLLAQKNSGMPTPQPAAGDSVDTAVVGGGVSGLYTAWRLTNATTNNTRVYEASGRTGGRLFSRPIADACPTLVTELGGMRLRVGSDFLAFNVVDKLGIKLRPFPLSGDPATYGPVAEDPRNTLLLRGVRMTRGQYANLTLGEARRLLPYNLRTVPAAVDNDALPLSTVLGYPAKLVLDAVSPLADVCGGRDAALAATYWRNVSGQQVYMWSLAALFDALGYARDVMDLADDAGGYDAYETGTGLTWLHESIVDKAVGASLQRYVRPEFGLQQVATALQADFEHARAARGHAGAGVTLSRRLISVARAPASTGRKYALRFVETLPNACLGTYIDGNATHMVYADRVVLAMPSYALQALRQPDDGLIFGPSGAQLDNLLHAVTWIDAVKVFVAWNSSNVFNRALNASAGRHLSSEYASQLFSWWPGTASLEPQGNSCDNLSVAQIYVAGALRESLWRALRQRALYDATGNCPVAIPYDTPRAMLDGTVCLMCRGAANTSGYFGPASEGITVELKDMLMRNVAGLWGVPVASVPEPLWIRARMYSSVDVLSGGGPGVATWVTGRPFWLATEEALQPQADEAIHIVGDGFSAPPGHGWVEGALRSVERLLVTKVGLQPLAGLTRTEVCTMDPFSTTQPPA